MRAALDSAVTNAHPQALHCADDAFLPVSVRADFVNALDEFYLARAPTLSVRPEPSSAAHSSASSEAAAKAAERNREQAKRKLAQEQKVAEARAQKASSHKGGAVSRRRRHKQLGPKNLLAPGATAIST